MQRGVPPEAGHYGSLHHAVETSMLLAFDHVTKFYGPVIGVNDITFRVGPGITGLLGANGAGKSTLIKLASGQLRPSQGTVRIGQHHAWSTAAKHHLGYSPDVNSFYEEMTGHEFVYTMARLHGFTRPAARHRTEYVLEEVGMADRAKRRLAGCSHGMRQRIKLARPSCTILGSCCWTSRFRALILAGAARSTSCSFALPAKARRSSFRAISWSKSNSYRTRS